MQRNIIAHNYGGRHNNPDWDGTKLGMDSQTQTKVRIDMHTQSKRQHTQTDTDTHKHCLKKHKFRQQHTQTHYGKEKL